MPARVPGEVAFKFVENARTGTVHIHLDWPVYLTAKDPIAAEVRGGSAFIALLQQPTVVLCGLRTWPTCLSGGRHQWTDRFRDDQLCAACHRLLHPDDQARAFAHDQPEETR